MKQPLSTPARRPYSLLAFADTALAALRESAFRVAAPALARAAEAAVVAVLQNIVVGRLRILTYPRMYTFPALQSEDEPCDGPYAELRVVRPTFWIRLFAMGDLGFSEAYMFGDVECDDLVSLMQIFLANREGMSTLASALAPVFSAMSRITSSRFVNSLANASANISAHYDISNSMFQAFLSEDMTYSCAIFDTLDDDLKRHGRDPIGGEALSRFGPESENTPLPSWDSVFNGDLYDAQIRKLRSIIRKADLRPGQRVLEIGSGWASLAILAVQSTGCQVDTITLSVQQKTLAEEKIAALGLTEKIAVHLLDYRALPAEWKASFDRVISIEMIEAVGHQFLQTYFGVIDWALKPKGAVAVIQAITIPEARFERYLRELDFIQKLFPGGFLPTVTLLLESARDGAAGRLVCDSVINIGPHYARTLREWRRRFQATFESLIKPAMLEEHPELQEGGDPDAEIEVFRRKWLYYYCYCEVGFTNRILGDHIVTFVREGAKDYQIVPYE